MSQSFRTLESWLGAIPIPKTVHIESGKSIHLFHRNALIGMLIPWEMDLLTREPNSESLTWDTHSNRLPSPTSVRQRDTRHDPREIQHSYKY